MIPEVKEVEEAKEVEENDTSRITARESIRKSHEADYMRQETTAVNMSLQFVACLLFFQVISPPRARREFHWDWRRSESPSSSLKDVKLADSERAALAKAITAQVGPPDRYDPEMASEDQVRRAVLSADVSVIRLNQRETKPLEVVAQVQHFCSPTGNCTLWFFRRSPRGYKLLLEAIGQGFAIQDTSTNGFFDLVVDMHSSATEQWLKAYRYAHGRYWRVACYDADRADKPHITPSRCN